jgi:hypothetical protein
MRIKIDAFNYDIERALDWIGSQIGNPLQKRVKGFQQEQRRNPLLEDYYRRTFSLELALAEAWRTYQRSKTFPTGDEYTIAYGFSVTAHRVNEALSPRGRNRLSGSLRDGARGLYGLRPLAYELNIAAHLSWKGYDVECVDLEGKGRFEFLASKNGAEFEIECKTTSPDKGRKIHRKDFNNLTYDLLPVTKDLVEAGGCHVIRLIIPDRLQANKQQIGAFKGVVSLSISNGSAITPAGRSEYKLVTTDRWPEPDELERVGRELSDVFFGAGNRHVVWHYRPNHGFVVIGAESEKPDSVSQSLADDAKAAAEQCTGRRPALVTIQLFEITAKELDELRQTSSGIQFVAHEVFKNQQRSHVDSIVFSLPPTSASNQLTGTVAVLHNPSPKIPSDHARSLFRPQTGSLATLA